MVDHKPEKDPLDAVVVPKLDLLHQSRESLNNESSGYNNESFEKIS